MWPSKKPKSQEILAEAIEKLREAVAAAEACNARMTVLREERDKPEAKKGPKNVRAQTLPQ